MTFFDNFNGGWAVFDSSDLFSFEQSFHTPYGQNINWTGFTELFFSPLPEGFGSINIQFYIPDRPSSSTMYAELDDISLNFDPSGQNDFKNTITHFSISHTDLSSVYNIKVSATRKNNLTFTIKDITGREVERISKKSISHGTYNYQVNLNQTKGIYILTL